MDEKRIIELLTINGLSRNVSVLLLELREVNGQGITQTELIEKTGLNQPAISIATAQAYRDGFLKYTVHQKGRGNGKGRPYYRYSLKKSFAEIVREIADGRAQEIAGMMADLKALKAVV